VSRTRCSASVKRSGAPLIRDRQRLLRSRVCSASFRHSASKTRVNALKASCCAAPGTRERRYPASCATAGASERTNLRLWESSAGSDPLFRVVLYNENCNPNVSSRQRVATAWGCRRVRSPPPTCRCRRRDGLSTPRACWPWLRSQARHSAASPPASPRFRESPCSRAR
jgi:hypothetical protein